MKVKQRVGDFRVRELLKPGVLGDRGPHRVYRLTKRKLTSIEAASRLADALGVRAGDVALIGMKDRQGTTTQFMSVAQGRPLSLRTPNLRVETAGFAQQELDGTASAGNLFDITVRAIGRQGSSAEHGVRARLNGALAHVREHGCVNYFGEQRFGNLRHGQGWIARRLMEGDVEGALRALISSTSRSDPPRVRSFKAEIVRNWRDWEACCASARRFGEHRSLFEHLLAHPRDFSGAFRYVALRLRLIHLYAFQSHLWNRAAAAWIAGRTRRRERVVCASPDGLLYHHAKALPADELSAVANLALCGPCLEGVENGEQRALYEDVLSREGIPPERLRIDGVPGFQLRSEPRALVLRPRGLRVRPPEPDSANPGMELMRLSFQLPPGSYATVLVERLFARRDTATFGERTRNRLRKRQKRMTPDASG
jgi:tRNA pseudouridine13 synthase